jgi:hypothetical protein
MRSRLASAARQVLRRIPRDDELGEEDDVGAGGARLLEPRQDPRAVSVEVADDGVHLDEGESHPASRFATNSRKPTLPTRS